MNILYTAHATSSGGRTGKAATDDGRLSVTLDTVKEFGGAGGPGTNPEQLFAAGYAACFHSALKFVGGQMPLKVPADSSVTAHVGIGPFNLVRASAYRRAGGHAPSCSGSAPYPSNFFMQAARARLSRAPGA